MYSRKVATERGRRLVDEKIAAVTSGNSSKALCCLSRKEDEMYCDIKRTLFDAVDVRI